MVFSLGCLKKSLLALVAVSLLVSIGQLVLIFINNKIFGAIMFVMYILFFLAILLALCRDSVSMYAACTVLLIVFVIGCSLIQAYDVEVKDLLKLESTTTESTEEITTSTTEPPRRRRDVLHQMLQSEAQWKPQGQVTAWPPAEDRLPMYPVNSQPIPMEASPDQRQAQQSFDYQPAPSLPPQPTLLPPNVPEVTIFPKYEPRQGARQSETTPPPPPPSDPPEPEPEPEPEEPQKKKYRWRNELRWVSNVLGVLHILILAVVICILYEMLFGGRYRYRTWC